MAESSSPVFYAPPLLGPGDPPPFTVLNPDGRAKALLVCDHAATAVPAKLGLLGLGAEDYTRHYAVDIGVRSVTEQLSALIDAPAIVANYSRLVVDLNRDLQHPTAFAQSGEGKPVPGNITMTDEDRQCRIDEIYNPYHAALAGMIDGFLGRKTIPLILSIHSFTSVFFRQKRPWEVGVMWTQDKRMAGAIIEFFRGKGFNVGDNEPYDGRFLQGTTMNRHADSRRLPNVLIEIRNDMIRTAEGGVQWANYLKEFINQILADDSHRTLYDGPVLAYDPELSRTYFENLNKKAQQADDT
ncbi:MAG: N-formylglutamate amidohydrolase [Micavibrio aeruginosavorus]|nr:N-formylglutamate amidohydrolase [Micavibrio aeruginosavorus]